jgi:hypothetical protein
MTPTCSPISARPCPTSPPPANAPRPSAEALSPAPDASPPPLATAERAPFGACGPQGPSIGSRVPQRSFPERTGMGHAWRGPVYPGPVGHMPYSSAGVGRHVKCAMCPRPHRRRSHKGVVRSRSPVSSRVPLIIDVARIRAGSGPRLATPTAPPVPASQAGCGRDCRRHLDLLRGRGVLRWSAGSLPWRRSGALSR